MAAQLSQAYISEEEYLAAELLSETKHEYIDGVTYAVAGVSKNHQRINLNLSSALLQRLQERP